MVTTKLKYFLSILFINIFIVLLFSPVVFGLEGADEKPIVDDKYRLSKDREELSKLRQQIPEEKRKENDEVAFTLSLMSELRLRPAEVRERFNTAMRKKRELFNKDMQKYREDFTRAEKSERSKFSKDLENERKEIRGKKLSSEERKEINDKLESKRRNFYGEQKDKREQFEADIRTQRKNFEDYSREKNNDFTQEHRAYSKRYEDFRKEKEAERKNSQSSTVQPTVGSDTSFQEKNQSSPKIVSPSNYGITKEELEKAFQDAQSKPAKVLEPGK